MDASDLTNAARTYSAEGILRDGGSVHIRAIRPDDKERLASHFTSLSPRSVYLRFFSAKRQLTGEELARFTELDFVHHVGIVATLRLGEDERIIGVGRFISHHDRGAPHRAEIAFAVSDAYQGRGVGTLLLAHLLSLARARGITEFEAEVLGENNRMLGMFADSGLLITRSIEGGTVHLSMQTEQTPRFVAASIERERLAAAQSVRAFLNPRSVAVVGASPRPQTIGRALLDNLVSAGFAGPLYPVNPKHSAILGHATYPDVVSIGDPVDLAVIAVPAPAVEAALIDCAHAGVRSVIVISSGFAEVSAEGRATERRLAQLARESGMRLVGPNCMGVLNTDPAVALNATFASQWPPAGNISMLSQSGALGLAILDYVRVLNLGIASFVSVGNKADVSGNDLLSYWSEDPRTAVIVLYLESFGNPRKFARLAPSIARQKPIVAVKSGRSAAGSRAASSHSAALADLDVAVDALFEQAGVIRTNTLEELFDVTALLATQPLPRGRRVGVVTNAGGPGILLADACEAHGLTLPALHPDTQAALRGFLPAQAGLANPVDMIASATPEHYERTMAAVGTDPAIDSLVVIYIPPLLTNPDEIAAGIARGAAAVPAEKPLLSVFMSSRGTPARLGAGPRGQLPSYTFPEDAALALAAAERYSRWRARAPGEPFQLDRFAQSAVRAVVDRIVSGTAGPCWVDATDVVTLLAAIGISVAAGERTAPSETGAAAERLGYPLVAKVISPDVLHKSDIGGVITGLDTRSDVEQAVTTLQARMRDASARLDAILLQREVRGGLEALVGVTTDPTFGPLVVCGLGGVLVEVLKDVVFRLPPVTDIDAQEMISKLRAAVLLDGYRGSPPGDRDALVSVIMRISALLEIAPEIVELDLNPVKVLPPGRGAVVVDARMRLTPVVALPTPP